MYIYAKRGKIEYLKFVLLDIFSICFAFSLAYFIRHGNIDYLFRESIGIYSQILFIMVLTHVGVAYLFDIFSKVDKRGYFKEAMTVTKQNGALMFVFLMYLFMTQQGDNYSRSVYLMFFCINMFLMYVLRIGFKAVYPRIFKNINVPERLYVVTTSDGLYDILYNLKQGNEYEVKGIILLDKDQVGKRYLRIPVVAGEDDIFEHLRLAVVDGVFIHLPNETNRIQPISKVLTDMGITVHINIQKLPFNVPNKTVHELGEFTVISSSMRIATPYQVITKRALDISGALVGLLFTGVISIFIAPLIYLESPGPIFFKQTRIGRNGRKFTIYKFRSMYMDAEERKKELMDQNKMNGLMFKMDDDPRITKIGKFIRKTSIDELPQFLNVLKGDMSLVGTRPPTLDEYTNYELHHKKRLSMKPGLTGLWQVSGRSNIVDFEEVVQLDAEYISKWSVGLDCKLILKTVGVLLGDRNAS